MHFYFKFSSPSHWAWRVSTQIFVWLSAGLSYNIWKKKLCVKPHTKWVGQYWKCLTTYQITGPFSSHKGEWRIILIRVKDSEVRPFTLHSNTPPTHQWRYLCIFLHLYKCNSVWKDTNCCWSSYMFLNVNSTSSLILLLEENLLEFIVGVIIN